MTYRYKNNGTKTFCAVVLYYMTPEPTSSIEVSL